MKKSNIWMCHTCDFLEQYVLLSLATDLIAKLSQHDLCVVSFVFFNIIDMRELVYYSLTLCKHHCPQWQMKLLVSHDVKND